MSAGPLSRTGHGRSGARLATARAGLAACCAALVWSWPAAAAGARPDHDSLEARLRACTACHGDQGRAARDGYHPRLAGKPAAYLYEQLLNFRADRRRYRPMQPLLDPLDERYLREIAEHFASRSVPYPAPAPATADAATLERGRRLVLEGDPARGLPACAACHGPALTGRLPAVPGLLGLPRDYLMGQLGAWRIGQRRAREPDCMAEVARRLGDDELAAITHWLAAQPVPGGGAPAPASASPRPLDCGSDARAGP